MITERSRTALRSLAGGRQVGWVAEHRGLLQGAAVALGAVVLFSWDPPTAGVVLITAALVAGAVALIAAIASAGRESPVRETTYEIRVRGR